jgi:hypothetical protein
MAENKRASMGAHAPRPTLQNSTGMPSGPGALPECIWSRAVSTAPTVTEGKLLWVPCILFFVFPASPHTFLFGYLPLTMLFLRALNACISFLLLILWVVDNSALCVCVPSALLRSG